MEKWIAIVLVVAIMAGALSLRLLGRRRRPAPRGGEEEALRRWGAHLLKGGREDYRGNRED